VKLGTSREHLLPHLGRRHPFKAKKLEIELRARLKGSGTRSPLHPEGAERCGLSLTIHLCD